MNDVRSQRRRLIPAALVVLSVLGGSARASAQEKTFTEKAKEYWDKVVKGLEAGADAYGAQFHKMKADAGRLTGKAKEKMSEEMEILGKKWTEAREKLSASLEKHMVSVGDEILDLEKKAAKATGAARDKFAAEKVKLKHEWETARAKMSENWKAGMKAASDEYAHLAEEASQATADAKAKLEPKLARMKEEWTKNKDKAAAFLAEDYRKTKEDMAALGDAATNSAKVAKQTLESRLEKLKTKMDDLSKEKPPGDK